MRRILIGPTEVAGFAQGLQQGLAQAGVEAELVLECRHPFGYAACEASAAIARAWKWAGTRARALASRSLWLAAPAYAAQLLLAWPLLGWALLRYDAFVFLYGKTLTNTGFELWLMRLLGKPTLVVYLGSDARPAYINGVWAAEPVAALARRVRRQKARLRRVERLATACVNAPATAHFHERPVINWFALGFARHVAAATRAVDRPVARVAGAVRIVHSPSAPKLKGTAQIRACVERLQARGLALEFVMLSGLANEQVLDALSDCDLLVDQLYSDTPMAGLATEAALLGKPALVGGYLARDLPQALGGMPLPPTRFVAPEQFEQALDEMARDPALRSALGAAAQRFVQSEWSCEQVARRVLRILAGGAPPEWWFGPQRVDYLAGCGLSEDAGRERVRALLAHGGLAALQLGDKPRLEQAFAAWAGVRCGGDAKPEGGAA